jgi:hypothetical protein
MSKSKPKTVKITHYILRDGTRTTTEAIAQAVRGGKARLVHGYGDGKITTTLMIDGRDIDNRGNCFSVWEEVWTQKPRNVQQAIQYAKYVVEMRL